MWTEKECNVVGIKNRGRRTKTRRFRDSKIDVRGCEAIQDPSVWQNLSFSEAETRVDANYIGDLDIDRERETSRKSQPDHSKNLAKWYFRDSERTIRFCCFVRSKFSCSYSKVRISTRQQLNAAWRNRKLLVALFIVSGVEWDEFKWKRQGGKIERVRLARKLGRKRMNRRALSTNKCYQKLGSQTRRGFRWISLENSSAIVN